MIAREGGLGWRLGLVVGTYEFGGLVILGLLYCLFTCGCDCFWLLDLIAVFVCWFG